MRRKAFLARMGILSCLTIGLLTYGCPMDNVHATESKLQPVNLAVGVTWNEESEFIDLNGNSVVIREVKGTENELLAMQIFIDSNQNGEVDSETEVAIDFGEIFTDAELGDATYVPLNVSIYGLYQKSSTTPIRITVESGQIGNLIGVSGGELCVESNSNFDAALELEVKSGNVSNVRALENATLEVGKAMQQGVVYTLAGGRSAGGNFVGNSDILSANASTTAIRVNMTGDSAMTGGMNLVASNSQRRYAIQGNVELSVDYSASEQVGSLGSTVVLTGTNDVSGSVKVDLKNTSCNNMTVASSGNIIYGDVIYTMDASSTVSYLNGLQSSTAKKNVNFVLDGTGINWFVLLNGLASGEEYTVEGNVLVTNQGSDVNTFYISQTSVNVKGNVTYNMTDGTLGEFWGTQSSTIGGDVTFAIGTEDKAVAINDDFYSMSGCKVGGSYTVQVYNANTEANAAPLYVFHQTQSTVAGDVSCTLNGGYYTSLNAGGYGVVKGNYNFTVKDAQVSSEAKGLFGVSVDGDATITMSNVKALYTLYAIKGSGCTIKGVTSVEFTNITSASEIYAIDGGTYEKGVTVKTMGESTCSNFHAVGQSTTIEGDLTIQTSGLTSTSSNGIYNGVANASVIKGNLDFDVEENTFNTFYATNGGAMIGGIGDILLKNCNFGTIYLMYLGSLSNNFNVKIEGGTCTAKLDAISQTSNLANVNVICSGVTFGTEGENFTLSSQLNGNSQSLNLVVDTDCTFNGETDVSLDGNTTQEAQIVLPMERYYVGDVTITEDTELDNIYLSNGALLTIAEGVTLTVNDMVYADAGTGILLKGTLDGKVCQEDDYANSFYYMDGGSIIPTDQAIQYVCYPLELLYADKAGAVTLGGACYSYTGRMDGVFGAAGKEIYVTYEANKGYAFTSATAQKESASEAENMTQDETTATKYNYVMPAEPVAVEVAFTATQIEATKTLDDPVAKVNETTTVDSPLYDMASVTIANDADGDEVSYKVDSTYSLPEGLQLVNGKIYGTPTVEYKDGKKTIIHITGNNGTTASVELNIVVLKGVASGLPTEITVDYGSALSTITLPHKANGVWYLGEKAIESPIYSDVTVPEGKFVWKDGSVVVNKTGMLECYVNYVPEDDNVYNIVSDIKVIVKVNHTHAYSNEWTTDDNNHWKLCVCGDMVEKEAHTWDAGVVTTPATATMEGAMTYTCTVCGKTKTASIPMTGTTASETPDASTTPVNVVEVPAAGTVLADDDANADYVVTNAVADMPEVSYKFTNKKATSVVIPDTIVVSGITYKVTSIVNNAFKNHKKLKKVTIGANIITIGKNAFNGCKKLTTVKMGKSVEAISDGAFQNCTALKKIEIPSKVNKIGKKAFYGCKKLTNITIKTTMLTTKNVGKDAFKKAGSADYSKLTVKVPKKKLKAYKTMLKKRGLSSKAKVKK